MLKVTDSSDSSRTCKSFWPRWCIGCSIWHCRPDEQGFKMIQMDTDLYAEFWIVSYNKLQIHQLADERCWWRKKWAKHPHPDTSWHNWHVIFEAWTSIFRLDATIHERASWIGKNCCLPLVTGCEHGSLPAMGFLHRTIWGHLLYVFKEQCLKCFDCSKFWPNFLVPTWSFPRNAMWIYWRTLLCFSRTRLRLSR